MHLSLNQIHKFKEIYHRHFGEELSDVVAYQKAVKLVRLMEIILRQKADKLPK